VVRTADRVSVDRRATGLQRDAIGPRQSAVPRIPFAVSGNGLTARPMDKPTVYAAFAATIDAALAALEAEGVLPPGGPRDAVSVEPPRDPAHGDLATNAAMVLAKQ